MSATPPGLLPDVVTDSSALRPNLLDFFYGFEQLIPNLDHHPDRGISLSGLFHHSLKITSLAGSKIFLGLLGSHREGVDCFELIAKNIPEFFPVGINGLGRPGGIGESIWTNQTNGIRRYWAGHSDAPVQAISSMAV
jgi:hypothetical protein